MKVSKVAIILVLLALLAPLALLRAPHSFATADELLVNGGFEGGSTSPWGAYVGSLSLATSPVHSGGHAAEFTASTLQAGFTRWSGCSREAPTPSVATLRTIVLELPGSICEFAGFQALMGTELSLAILTPHGATALNTTTWRFPTA